MWDIVAFSFTTIAWWVIQPIANSAIHIWNALRDLVAFVQFKKREKQLWMIVTFSKFAGFNLRLQLNQK